MCGSSRSCLVGMRRTGRWIRPGTKGRWTRARRRRRRVGASVTRHGFSSVRSCFAWIRRGPDAVLLRVACVFVSFAVSRASSGKDSRGSDNGRRIAWRDSRMISLNVRSSLGALDGRGQDALWSSVGRESRYLSMSLAGCFYYRLVTRR